MSLVVRSSTGANSACLLQRTLALQARGCQLAPSVRPSQSSTNRSRGSGVRRHSWSRKPGPGGLVQLRRIRASGSPAAGERTSGGQSGGECQPAACAPGPGRASVARANHCLAPPGRLSAAKPLPPRFGSRAPGPVQRSCSPGGHGWGI